MLSLKCALIAASLALALIQGDGSGYKLEKRYPVPGNGGFDYVTIDSLNRRLYLAHDHWTLDQVMAEMNQYEFGSGVGHGKQKAFVNDYWQQLQSKPANLAVTAK